MSENLNDAARADARESQANGAGGSIADSDSNIEGQERTATAGEANGEGRHPEADMENLRKENEKLISKLEEIEKAGEQERLDMLTLLPAGLREAFPEAGASQLKALLKHIERQNNSPGAKNSGKAEVTQEAYNRLSEEDRAQLLETNYGQYKGMEIQRIKYYRS